MASKVLVLDKGELLIELGQVLFALLNASEKKRSIGYDIIVVLSLDELALCLIDGAEVDHVLVLEETE